MKNVNETRPGVDKVKPKVWFRYSLDWHFYNSPNRNIDDVLLEHVGLPHVLPLTVHLRFFLPDKYLSYSLSFVVGPLLHA